MTKVLYRPRGPRLDEHHIQRGLVWRGDLVAPIRRTGREHDVVVPRTGVAKIALVHGIEVNQQHSPSRFFEGKSFRNARQELLIVQG